MFREYRSIKKHFNDRQGQVFTLDALLAIVLITIAIGVSANAMEIVNYKITDHSAGKSLDRITTDAADILINTPGTYNWEKSNNTLFVTPGLAEENNGSVNTTKTLSFSKITQLRNNYHDLMSNVIPRGAGSSLIIYPTDSQLSPIVLNNETPPPDVQVSVANRSVLINLFDFKILTSIKTGLNRYLYNLSENNTDICPHFNLNVTIKHEKPDIATGTHGWNCRHFKITQQDLMTTDFYIMTDPSVLSDGSARWIFDRADNISEEVETFESHPKLVNDKIGKLLGDDNEALLWVHVLSSTDSSKSFNTYVIGVPKNTSPEIIKIENLSPKPFVFVLKVWME
jgi:hypothetical protein